MCHKKEWKMKTLVYNPVVRPTSIHGQLVGDKWKANVNNRCEHGETGIGFEPTRTSQELDIAGGNGSTDRDGYVMVWMIRAR